MVSRGSGCVQRFRARSGPTERAITTDSLNSRGFGAIRHHRPLATHGVRTYSSARNLSRWRADRLPTASGRLRGRDVRGDQRRVQRRIGEDRPVGDEVRSDVADTALRRSGDDDLSVAAGDDLPVDEDVLAIVDRDAVAVRVGVGAPAADADGYGVPTRSEEYFTIKTKMA